MPEDIELNAHNRAEHLPTLYHKEGFEVSQINNILK